MLHSGRLGLTRKHKTKLERVARDKRPSLLQKFVIYGRNEICNIGPWSYSINYDRKKVF